MKHREPNGGKSTASRPDDASSDEQTVVQVTCDLEGCPFDEPITGKTRHMAIARATMASATHEHPTTRTIDDHEPSMVTITGPDVGDIYVGGSQ